MNKSNSKYPMTLFRGDVSISYSNWIWLGRNGRDCRLCRRWLWDLSSDGIGRNVGDKGLLDV